MGQDHYSTKETTMTKEAAMGQTSDTDFRSGHTVERDWMDEDPGNCCYCGKAFEMVRPGKSQETCECYTTAHITNGELDALRATVEQQARTIAELREQLQNKDRQIVVLEQVSIDYSRKLAEQAGRIARLEAALAKHTQEVGRDG
jgi:hypothetical protein